MDRNILYYGSREPLPERIPLHAGPLALIYEQGDLRSICLEEHEILRRVYVAIRDRNWGTVASVFTNVQIQAEPERFAIAYDVENRTGEIDFAWHGEIHGEADGTLTFAMDGTARSTFYKNRIGFCVLHPAGLSGQLAEVEHVDGVLEQTQFAVDICANQPVEPFVNLRAIRHMVKPGVWAEVTFAGDIFEMEDQRLWTDASYKTFCTPLGLPYPVEIQAGTRIVQSVILKLMDQRRSANNQSPDRFTVKAKESTGMSVLINAAGDWRSMPALGLATACHGQQLSEHELERLRALHLHHLRVELRLSEPGYVDRLKQAAVQAEALNIPLEVALAISSGETEIQLSGLSRLMDELSPKVCGWLVFPEREPYSGGNPSEAMARLARAILKPFAREIPLAVGTNTDFIFLKRTKLPLPWMDQVCITLNPQVHAFDQQSIVETLEAQPMVVESARRMAEGRPVVVSPVTLRPRFNPYATMPQPQLALGELPSEVDPRQMSLFGAGWTLGSLRAMVLSGVERVTYYETTGWRGVIETDQGSTISEAFPSMAESVFPIYHLLADYGEFAGGQVCALNNNSPQRVSGLALRRGDHLRYILANHTAKPMMIILETASELFEFCSLDETNTEAAMREPDKFRQSAGMYVCAVDGKITLKLQSYGILRLDSISYKNSTITAHRL